jgi:hypothetical protein
MLVASSIGGAINDFFEVSALLLEWTLRGGSIGSLWIQQGWSDRYYYLACVIGLELR